MSKSKLSIVVFIVLISVFAYSQNFQRGDGTIIGAVYDEATKHPISYANIVLHNAADSAQITGTITDENGDFELSKIHPGSYYVEIHFIGYDMKRIEDVRIERGQRVANLEDIYIVPVIMSTESVEVVGERPSITYQIDKKVIDVDKFSTSVSGNAIDILENIPSVSVNIDGNVSLRGSSNFTLLIDGRPSILEPSDALEQIPSSTIEEIEIITNPSVKFDPEGTSGIMNIILKKNRESGSSGMMNLNGGLNDKYGGDILLDYQNGKYHATISLDYNKRYMDGQGEERNTTTYENNTSTISSDESSLRGRISKGFRAELEYKLSAKDILNFGGRYGDRTSEGSNDADYTQWSDNEAETSYISASERNRDGTRYALFSSYRHYFREKGHELYSEVYYRYSDGDETAKNGLLTPEGRVTSGHNTIEKGPSSGWRAKLDYTIPLNKDNKFEAGYQADLDYSEDITELSEYDDSTDQYIDLVQFNNSTFYDKNVQAIYALYSNTINQFGFQIGLRGEYTNRIIEYNAKTNPFEIDRWDYFPTIHSSYEFLTNQRIMASYARRIRRPRGWQLEPFETWTDAYNVRRGNPSIKPQYIDSYELGYQTNIGKTLFSTEFYYRMTKNKIEHVNSVYADNIALHTFDNVGKDYASGSELLFNFDPMKKWSVNLMGNLYYYLIEGKIDNESYSRDSFNWRTRLRNNIKLGSSTELQIDGVYDSPSVSAQEEEKENYYINLALKQVLIDKILTATLQIRDVFATSRHEEISKGPDFYLYNYHKHEAPIVMLNIRLVLNNYKPDRRERNSDEMNGDDEGEF